jgi:hypothetical protein
LLVVLGNVFNEYTKNNQVKKEMDQMTKEFCKVLLKDVELKLYKRYV